MVYNSIAAAAVGDLACWCFLGTRVGDGDCESEERVGNAAEDDC